MFKNHFKIAFRNILKNKGYSFLNIFGLAIGIACASLIFLWVEDELNYNDYFAKKENIYKVKDHQTYGGDTYSFDATPGLLADGIKADFPEIENTARSSVKLQKLFTNGEKNLYAKGHYVDPSFLSIFDLKFIKGDPGTVFNKIRGLIITETLAKNLYGSTTEAYGQNLTIDNDQDHVITGIIKDLPQNVSFEFQWLAPFHIYESQNDWLQYWASMGVLTYATLEPHANLAQINAKLYDYINTKQEGAVAKMELYPMSRWRLYDTFENGKEIPGQQKYVSLFSLIAWLILFIACINFMNLSTARSQKRAREVGVRKVLGSGKKSLILQFLGESVTTALLAAVLSVILIYAALPFFNTLVGKELSVGLFNPLHLIALLTIAVICGVISGIFPAYYLSSFKPVDVLKGLKLKESNAGKIRKGLVVVQFAASVTFIISTVIIYQQIGHIKDRNLGFEKQHLLYTEVNEPLQDHFEQVKNELLATGFVENAALSTQTPLMKNSSSGSFEWKGKNPNQDVLITFDGVSSDYRKTLGIELKEGRDFYQNTAVDSASILINQSFADLIGGENIIGSKLKHGNQRFTIVGIVGNFIYNNLYEKSSPLIFTTSTHGNYLNIRFKSGINVSRALPVVEDIFKENNPGYPFEYTFVDQRFNDSFKTETLIGKLAGVFAILAIFISCLGLFGLASYTAEQRKKEIGVRKILGASVENLTKLLSKDFLKLVAISCIVAFPLAWYIMNNWLQDYAYRIEIHWWVFAIAGIGAIGIALFTVSFQAIKAAIANPVKSLRTE